MLNITIHKTDAPKEKPAKGTALGFGNLFTDHMFLMDYSPDQGWHDARIVPYGPLTLDPAASVLHYGQACFEGLKAYRGPDGKVRLFRPDCNGRRMMQSMRRMCMPEIPEEDFVQAIRTLCRVEEAWVPDEIGSSLYFRPLAIATTPKLGVHASGNYLFCVLASPAGASTWSPTTSGPPRAAPALPSAPATTRARPWPGTGRRRWASTRSSGWTATTASTWRRWAP